MSVTDFKWRSKHKRAVGQDEVVYVDLALDNLMLAPLLIILSRNT